MRYATLLFLLCAAALGGEPFAFRVKSNFQPDKQTLCSQHGLSFPVRHDGNDYIITAAHVILYAGNLAKNGEKPKEILVDFPVGWIRCEIVKLDRTFDLCVLRPAIKPPFVLNIEEKGPKEGQKIINPNFFVGMEMSMKKGKMTERIGPLWTARIEDFNHGSSGGPVLDEKGRVIALGIAMFPLEKDKALLVGSNIITKYLKLKGELDAKSLGLILKEE